MPDGDPKKKKTDQSKFAAKQPPGPDASKFAPPFMTPAEKKQNIFHSQTAQAIREFRSMMGNENARGPLTQEERKFIREIVNEAKADVKKYKIPLEVAASLRFASKEARLDHDQFMQKMIETGGNVSGADPAGLMKAGPFKFNVPKWLYMLKTHGSEHGLDYFADKIKVEQKGGGVTVDVSDPAVLREIIALRDNPRISAMMGAEYLKHQGEIPPIGYKDASFAVDPHVKEQQDALMTLGFDLGIKGADGVRGPLTMAAMTEFVQMSKPLLNRQVSLDDMIKDAAEQAKADSDVYTNKYRTVTPADAFAVRHAAKVVGVDYGFMMELAQSESGFKTDIKADTSSATGLFQFTDSTWLTILYKDGAKYGLDDIVKNIEVKKNKAGDVIDAKINDPLIEKYALDLRKDPRINSLMGAEFVKENKEILQAALPKQQINRTDQYVAHFLGAGQAVDFLSQMKKNPDGVASDSFPAAAGSNEGVFKKPDGTSRTFKEVYEFFKKKFYTKAFDNESEPKPPADPKKKTPGKPAQPTKL